MLIDEEPDHFENVFTLDVRSKTHAEEEALKDEDLLLASPILYGYSLSDKIWRTHLLSTLARETIH